MKKPDVPTRPVGETLDAYLEREDREPIPGRYYASSVMMCPAKHWFQRNGFKSDFPAGIGERGRRVEDYVLDALREEYGEDEILTQVPTQKEVVPGVMVSGKPDALRLDYNLGVRKIWEVKSMGGSPRDLKKGYEFQALFYDWVYKPSEGTEVIVINADDFTDRKVFPVEWTPDKWTEFQMYWVQVHDQMEEGGRPLPNPITGGWECYYYRKKDRKLITCPFYHECGKHGGPAYKVPESLEHKLETPPEEEEGDD